MSGRCKACDITLTEYEMLLKDLDGEYTELCCHCYDLIAITENGDDSDTTNEFYKEGRRFVHHYD